MGLKQSSASKALNRSPDAKFKGRQAQEYVGRIRQYVDEVLDSVAMADSSALVAEQKKIDLGKLAPVPCPCCGQEVVAASIEIIIDHYGIAPMPARILRAVWSGKGHPVKAERIFDAMYADDPDGGPHMSQMYNAMKIGIWRLRDKLKGSGVTIESAGYGHGYRLKLRSE